MIGLDDHQASGHHKIKRPPKMDIVLLGGALGSLFSVLQFIASPIIGKLSDALGRRRVLLIAMVTKCFLFVNEQYIRAENGGHNIHSCLLDWKPDCMWRVALCRLV
jgi:MFS family permease